ncbi:hypothetical protein J6590_062750, partial [Homalodisca vitripennis]
MTVCSYTGKTHTHILCRHSANCQSGVSAMLLFTVAAAAAPPLPLHRPLPCNSRLQGWAQQSRSCTCHIVTVKSGMSAMLLFTVAAAAAPPLPLHRPLPCNSRWQGWAQQILNLPSLSELMPEQRVSHVVVDSCRCGCTTTTITPPTSFRCWHLSLWIGEGTFTTNTDVVRHFLLYMTLLERNAVGQSERRPMPLTNILWNLYVTIFTYVSITTSTVTCTQGDHQRGDCLLTPRPPPPTQRFSYELQGSLGTSWNLYHAGRPLGLTNDTTHS